MVLTEKSGQVFSYVQENNRVSIDELVEQLGRNGRSIGASVNDLHKKGLVDREKVKGEGEDAKDITYVVLTDAGRDFVPGAED